MRIRLYLVVYLGKESGRLSSEEGKIGHFHSLLAIGDFTFLSESI